MRKRIIFQDLIGVWLLLTVCLFAGLVTNELRSNSLPLVYSPPEARLLQTVESMSPTPSGSLSQARDVELDEMRRVSLDREALILDARPEVFYQLGHIPSALSLPRDDFEKQYQALQPALQAHRDKVLVVYCSSNDCRDSEMVVSALEKLGYSRVRLFRGGWSDWQSASLPEEKE